MPSSDSWLSDPLGVIDNLFEKDSAVSSSDVVSFFSEKFKTGQSRLQIPSLNDVPLHELVCGSLVRYRCMVQDMFDPEFFLGRCEVQDAAGQRRLSTSMYRDIIKCLPGESVNFDSEQNVTADRQTLYCIPIPGENAWVKEAYSKQSGAVQRPPMASGSSDGRLASCKRALENSNDSAMRSCQGETGSAEMDVANTERSGDATASTTSEAKRIRGEDLAVSAIPVSTAIQLTDLNFPLPNEKGPACLVKLYDGSQELKLNDVVEIVGVLSTDPSMAVFSEPSVSTEDGHGGILEPMESVDAEHIAKNPPPSLVPRLHAILVSKLDHSNPCLPPDLHLGCAVTDVPALQEIGSLREELIVLLENALIDDRLAAEYLLCHLVSSVYGRQSLVALGKFSLNLSDCPRDRDLNFVGFLDHVLSLFVTKSHLLPLSLTNMNTLRFVPRKDYTTNRLRSGTLQLSDLTRLIVDETALESGQLDTNGVANMTALSDVVTWQKLDYDFAFHHQPFHTNIGVLVLSEGKSLLKCDCQVPLIFNPTSLTKLEETYRGIDAYLTPHLLDRIRAYLGHVQLLAYTVTDDVQKAIEEDFVASRRDGACSMSIDDFHSLLTLARLLSLSFAEMNLTSTTWQRAKDLESLRKLRIQAVGSGH